MNHLLRHGVPALFLAGALCAQTIPTSPYNCITLRSNGQSGITNYNGAPGQPLSPVPFTAADFAAACGGTAAFEVSALPYPCTSLTADPQARWINPNTLGFPRSTLYCQTFQIPTCNVQSASIRFSFCVDDQLGDPPSGPNPIGVYLNGQPIPGFGGLVAPQTTWTSTTIAPLLQSGANKLQVYARDTGFSISGVIYSATICYVGCRSDEVIKLHSGNGASNGPDSTIRMLGGAAQTPIAITPANLALAATGPAARVVPPAQFWCTQLTADPLAQWISTDAQYGPRSALYSQPFTISTCNILSASLSFSCNVSSMLGDPFGVPNVGLLVNQNPVPLSAIDGLGGGSCNLAVTANIPPAWLNANAPNTLYVYVRDVGHLFNGVMYSATLDVRPCPPQTEVIDLRSGNGLNGFNDAVIRCSSGPAPLPLSNAAFTTADFAAAAGGPSARIVSNNAWATSLVPDPLAQWVATPSYPLARSALFAHPFTVTTCAGDIKRASLTISYCADDGLGDPTGNGPNLLGIYLNGQPVPGTVGDISTWPGLNMKTITVSNVAPWLLNGANVLYLYDRDRLLGISGVMYSARITISPCDWRYYGNPCGQTVPNTYLSAAPVLGTSVEYKVRGDSIANPQFTPCFCVIGLSDQIGPGGLPLPLDLGVFGAPGCQLLAAQDLQLFLLTDAAGNADVSIFLPNNPIFAGFSLFFQTLLLDGVSNVVGLSATRGIAVDCRL
ncbi:MAG TPA: hypothetical protein VK348_05700 [Planctomycetota bacterium]|nr:hypothetical protein [Planctomycetota bacterium]